MFLSRIYWKTQLVLKRKWLLRKWPFNRTNDFQRFIILCDPRTGSTWLHTLLNSNPQILSYGEVLREKDNISALEPTIWRSHHSSIQAIGCKIFYEQLCESRFLHVFDELVSNKKIKVIDLSREDIRATFHSLKTAEKTGDWSGGKMNKEIEVPFEEKEFDLHVYKSNENRSKVLKALNQHELFSLSYEELVKDQTLQLNKLQRFLGLTPVSLFSLLQKQSK